MPKYETICDMGSIKIYNQGMSCFFANGAGDGVNTVEVRVNCGDVGGEFLGHFTVKKGEVHLSAGDCEDTPVHAFGVGRWFVHLVAPYKFVIEKVDEDTHA